MALRFRRGSESDRTNPSFVPEDGEPVWIVDTKRLYMGDGSTSGGVLVTGSSGSAGGETPGINDNTTGVVLTLDNATSTFTNDVELDGSDLILAGGSVIGTGDINILGNITASGTLAGNIANIGSINVTAGINAGAVIQAPFFVGDHLGSVFGDDSTLIINGQDSSIFSSTINVQNNIQIGDDNSFLKSGIFANGSRALQINDIVANDIDQGFLYINRIVSGSIASPTLINNNTSIYSLANQVYDGNSYVTGSAMSFLTDGTPTTGVAPQKFSLVLYNLAGNIDLTDGIHYRASQRIGIMTDDPQSTLDVNGNTIIRGNLEAAAFEFVGTNITTSDSSIITVTPAVTFSSDVVVENSLTVANTLTVDTLAVTNLQTSGAGTPELSSDTDILLTAGNEIVMTASDVKSKADVQVEGSVMLGKPASNNPDIFVPAVVNAAILNGISTTSAVDGANYVKEVFRQRLDRNTSGGELLLALNDINNATPANRHLIAKYLWHNNGTNTYTVASLGTTGNAALLASVAVTLDDAGGNFDLVVTVRMPTAQLSGATALVTGQLTITSNPLTASVSGIFGNLYVATGYVENGYV